MRTWHHLSAMVCLALTLALGAICAQAATNGFAQTGAGPYDYTNTANWVGGVINGIWDISLTNTANQGATFSADTTLSTPLVFSYAGNFGLNLRSDSNASRTLTLGGDITVNPVLNQTVSFGSTTANSNLNLNLGGVTRTLTVNGGKALSLQNSVTNGTLVCSGAANFFLYGPNYQTATILTNGGALYLDGTAALGSGTLTLCNGTTIGNNTGITTNINNTAMAWNGSFSFAASQNLSLGNGPVTLAGPLTLTAGGWTLTVGGAISGGNGIFDVTKAGAGTFAYNPAIAMTANQTVNVTAGAETLNGAISGSGYSLTKAGTGTLNLNGANTYSGGTVINGGFAQFGAGALPSLGLVAINAGAALNAVGAYANAGAWVASGKIATNSAGTLVLTGADSSSIDFSTSGYTALYLGASANSTLSGAITAGPNGYLLGGGGATLTLSAPNALSGNKALTIGGNVALTGGNNVSGVANVNSGTLALANTNGALANADLVVNPGAILAFDSSVSGVVGATRAKTVTLRGATLTVTGNSGANSDDTIVNALAADVNPAGGIATVTVTPNAAKNARLSAGGLVRTNNGVVLLRGTSLGRNAISAVTANNASISLTTPPTVIGGSGALGSTNISIIPWALGDTNASTTAMSFLTYDTANGIHPLDFTAEYDTNLVGGATSDHNFLIPASATYVCNGATTINSLWLQSASILTGSSPLTVTSGAIYGKDSTAVKIYKPIDFGTAEGVIGAAKVDNTAMNIYGGISGSGGLTIYTDGLVPSYDAGVYLQSSCTYTGKTTILGGLNVFADALPNGARQGDVYLYGMLQPSAALTMNGLFGSGLMRRGHSGNINVNVGDNNASSTFGGVIMDFGYIFLNKIGTGTLTLTGPSVVKGAITVQNGILSVASINSSPSSPSRVIASNMGAPDAGQTTIALGTTATTGQLTYTGLGETTDRAINLAGTTGGGALDASGTGPLVFVSNFTAGGAGSKTLTLKGVNTAANMIQGGITNNSAANRTSLLKDGVGRWVLSGTNSYTGPTTVTNGTLAINGLIVSPATVWSNAVLTGTGAIVTNNAAAVTVNAGGILDPGSVGGIGSLTVTGNVIFAGGVLRVDASGANADLLAVAGSVSSTAGTVLVTATPTGAGPWKILSCTTTLTPAFATDAAGYVVQKRNSNTEVWLMRPAGTTIFVR